MISFGRFTERCSIPSWCRHGDLLPEREDFQRSIGPRPDENTEGDKHCEQELKHHG